MSLGIILKNGDVVVDSLTIAEVFDKKHKNVLKDIRECILELENIKIGELKIEPTETGALKIEPTEFDKYFYLEKYIDRQGKERPVYYMNQKGFTLLVMGYRGQSAFSYKVAYIEQFEQMKRRLANDIPISEKTSSELVEIIRERLSHCQIIDQPKDSELSQDYYAVGIYSLLRYYGHDRNIPFDYLRELRPKVMEIGLARFEEIVNYCAVKDKLKLPYVRATAQDFQASEVDQVQPPLFSILGLLDYENQ